MTDLELQNFLASLSDQEFNDLAGHFLEKERQRRLQERGADGGLTPEEWGALKKGDPLECVKLIRHRVGLGLLEAKNYMDRARARARQG